MGLQETTFNGNDPREYPRADLIREDFDQLIFEKGRRVIIETALRCPCKSPSSNQQSNCKNCGGTGWTFINPRETRVVMTGMDAVSKLEGWSEHLRGVVNISCAATEQIAFMDKITALDGEAIYTEVLFVKKYGATYFAYTAYDIKKITYIALFRSTTQTYDRLIEGIDYQITGNAIKFLSNKTKIVDPPTSITIRYIYAPTFHVIEMKRETMESFRLTERGEKLQHLPLSAYGRRAHYILDAPNLAGDRLLDNSYVEDTCVVETKCEYPT